MLNMDLKKVDVFKVDELMPEDYIEIDGVVCEVVDITPLKDGYAIKFLDEYGETDFIEVEDDATFNFYVLIDE
jgi:hypothetical protein